MAKTNKELTELVDKLAEKVIKADSAMRYHDTQIKRLANDVNFLTDLVYQEKSFTEDVKIKLKKILDWTNSIAR